MDSKVNAILKLSQKFKIIRIVDEAHDLREFVRKLIQETYHEKMSNREAVVAFSDLRTRIGLSNLGADNPNEIHVHRHCRRHRLEY